MTSLCKLQFLGQFHIENMPKATEIAIILAYAVEEETVLQKRKWSIWTEVPFLYTSLFILYDCTKFFQNSLSEVSRDILKKRYK